MRNNDLKSSEGVHVVWFKRDLRVADHWPLAEAARRGRCLCLYVYEPELVEADDFDSSHLDFINQSLASLDEALSGLGASLTYRRGRMPDVLDELHERAGIASLWSHEETGNALTYARDMRVLNWARHNSVPWTEVPSNGVVRRLKTRDGWAAKWSARANAPLVPTPNRVEAAKGIDKGVVETPLSLGLPPSERVSVQAGGIDAAFSALQSFLSERGVNYRADMSSPGPGWTGCSRLSPYLALGTLSIRQVHQKTRRQLDLLEHRSQSGQAVDARWRTSLTAFQKRLRWHCHFIQKLEDQPDIEFHNMNRAYDGLREDEFDEGKFAAWCAGHTGYPMVDACMRALHQSGWINFRMRAMLVSFASYHLWLHWKRPALHLARLFLDYEPGIHYSQFQMQSGVTGINAIRIYSPIKQVKDQDLQGEFIRAYCPELANVPNEFIAEPHKMPLSVQLETGCRIGKHYPVPIVDHGPAYKEARSRIYAAKSKASARESAREVYQKHGSRRRPRRASRR